MLRVRVLTPVRMMLWIGVSDIVFQFLPISSNFTLYAKEMCCTA